MFKCFSKAAMAAGRNLLLVGVMMWGVFTTFGGTGGGLVESVVDSLLTAGLGLLIGGVVMFVLALVGPYLMRVGRWLVQDFVR